MTDLDLSDLEAARDDVQAAVMAILEVAVTNSATRDTLVPAMFRLGEAHGTIERAIQIVGKPAPDAVEGES